MKASRFAVGAAVAFALVLGACSDAANPPAQTGVADPCVAEGNDCYDIVLRSPDGRERPMIVEVADTPDERREGLMFRTEIFRGMLFVFPDEQPLSFWMKNTLIPLDVLYFDDEGTFVSSATMMPCDEDPCPGYPTAAPGKYALEMPAGFTELESVGAGWTLEIAGR